MPATNVAIVSYLVAIKFTRAPSGEISLYNPLYRVPSPQGEGGG